MTAELAAVEKIAQRLAIEIANRELAQARLTAQTAEITELRADIETLRNRIPKTAVPARKATPKKKQ